MRSTGSDLWAFVTGCLDLGVDAFDHAPVYGNYTVESAFGDQVLKRDPRLRNKMRLISKTGIELRNPTCEPRVYYDSSAEYVRRDVNNSLERLGTDHLDLLLVHRPDPMTRPEVVAEVLDALVKDGKVLSVGVSNYSPLQIDALQRHLRSPLVASQIELSTYNPGGLFDGSVDQAMLRQMQIMAWSPLAGGRVFDDLDPRAKRLRDYAATIAHTRDLEIDTVLYAWLFGIGAPMSVITGSMKIERIRAALAATELNLTHPEWYGLLEASRGYPVP